MEMSLVVPGPMPFLGGGHGLKCPGPSPVFTESDLGQPLGAPIPSPIPPWGCGEDWWGSTMSRESDQ